MATGSLLLADNEFTTLYDRNIRRVYQIAYLYLHHRQDAEDACQSVFEKYLCKGKRFADERHEKAWFITVTRNHCRDELKRHWKSRRVDLAAMDAVPAGEDFPMERLAEALLNLPEQYKQAVYLYYIEGYSVKEMAGLLKRRESTLRNHLLEGRRRLRIDPGGFYV